MTGAIIFFTVLGIILLTAFTAVILFFLNKKIGMLKNGAGQDEKDKGMLFLQNQLSGLQKAMDEKLSESHQAVFQQFSQSKKIVEDVTEKLTRLEETNKQVIGFTGKLDQLQDLLKSPKQRGIIGEYFLETVLKNVLPPGSYQMQYPYKDGIIVDAVVFVKNKVIPIDSKFSLENYNRLVEEKNAQEHERLEKLFKQDLKTRIDETAKYVRPEENTMDFAFMFIPAEAIYYDLLINQVGNIKLSTRDLIEYAMKEKHVIIVSPTSFLAYLQTVLQGLRALQIEESAKEIRHNVEKLGKHMLNYESYLNKLGSSLSTTVSHYNNAYKEFEKVEKDVFKITGAENENQDLEEKINPVKNPKELFKTTDDAINQNNVISNGIKKVEKPMIK